MLPCSKSMNNQSTPASASTSATSGEAVVSTVPIRGLDSRRASLRDASIFIHLLLRRHQGPTAVGIVPISPSRVSMVSHRRHPATRSLSLRQRARKARVEIEHADPFGGDRDTHLLTTFAAHLLNPRTSLLAPQVSLGREGVFRRHTVHSLQVCCATYQQHLVGKIIGVDGDRHF